MAWAVYRNFKVGDLVAHKKTKQKPRVLLRIVRHRAGIFLYFYHEETSEVIGFPRDQFELISPTPNGE
jgi:hypothetical protein